jgi:hypothetical protein
MAGDTPKARIGPVADRKIQEGLVAYWRTRPPGSAAFSESRALDLMKLFGVYAAQLLDVETRSRIASDPTFIPKQAIATVLRSLRPNVDATIPREVIWLDETVEEFQRRGGSSLTPGELMLVQPDGSWEKLIEITWATATARLPIRPPRHPFQFALRNGLNGKMFVQRLAPFIDSKVRELQFDPSAQVENLGAFSEQGLVPPSAAAPQKKTGPKPDVETFRRVAEIVQRIANGELWKTKLDEIAKALDVAVIAYPQTWPQRGIRSWARAVTMEPELMKKAIAYRLSVAKDNSR